MFPQFHLLFPNKNPRSWQPNKNAWNATKSQKAIFTFELKTDA